MQILAPTVLLSLSIVSALALGAVVLLSGRARATKWTFAALCLNEAAWAGAVIGIIQSSTPEQAAVWLRIAFVSAALLTSTFYTFITLMTRDRFQGNRIIAALLWAGSLFVAGGAFSDGYIQSITVHLDRPPTVMYGPVFQFYVIHLAIAFVISLYNLIRKLIKSSGLERRQTQHLLLAIYANAILGIVTNVLAPLLNISSTEPYGPAFNTVMMAWFAYAIVRYHLLDIWFIVSRTTVYLVTSAFVGAIFFGSVTLVHWQSASNSQEIGLLTSMLAGIFIAVVLQPIRDRVQLVVDRYIIKKRYDSQALSARISRYCAESVRMDELVRRVAEDIENTVGTSPVRVLLIDQASPQALVVEYDTARRDMEQQRVFSGAIVEYARTHTGPIILEQLLHDESSSIHRNLAERMREIDAYLCVPLKTTSGLIGLLTLGRKASRDIFTKEDTVAFTTVAGPLATAVENARLYRQLQDANLHRARILSSMRGGVVTVNAEGAVNLVNRSAVALFGSIELGQHAETLPAELAEILTYALDEQRDIRDFETVIDRPIGDKAHVAMSGSCLKNAEGEVSGAMALIYDLTQIKRLEQNAERADRLSSLGTLAAGMAHEIKNPLASIRSFSQLIPRRHNDPEFLSTFSEIVPHEVDRIDSIVSRLLEFARPTQVKYAPADLRKVLVKVITLVENQARKGNITVEHDLTSDALIVDGDEQQLVQVFLNLLLNAIEAMPKNRPGRIEVTVRFDSVHLHRKGFAPMFEVDCVRVTVRDNGNGIAPEFIEHLFTPFFTTKEEGTGLGLSVVHGIITEHGGTIDVSHVAGGGAEFVVTLPMAASAVTARDMS